MTLLQQYKKRLQQIEKELSTCRTSVLQDGWQTQRYAKKARKWDILAQRKMELIEKIDNLEFLEFKEKTYETMFCNSCGALNEFECACE